MMRWHGRFSLSDFPAHWSSSAQTLWVSCSQVGTVVTWGDESDGGDSRSVQAELSGVQTIYATSCVFAAGLEDGTVVTWGYNLQERWW